MASKHLKVRAVIFDVYNTLLEVGAPPGDADARWQTLFMELLGEPPPFNRMEFSLRTSRAIARRHAEARAAGIPWPEINWPAVVRETLPGRPRLTPEKFDDFLLRQTQLGRTLRLADHAAECLRQLNAHHLAIGIASNAQAYTLRELDDALAGAGLKLALFDRELRFWSFENGFSKPDPHVFRLMTARLEARGISPAETLMVGDRLDNDIEPARAQGWQTWHLKLKAEGDGKTSGGFRELRAALA